MDTAALAFARPPKYVGSAAVASESGFASSKSVDLDAPAAAYPVLLVLRFGASCLVTQGKTFEVFVLLCSLFRHVDLSGSSIAHLAKESPLPTWRARSRPSVNCRPSHLKEVRQNTYLCSPARPMPQTEAGLAQDEYELCDDTCCISGAIWEVKFHNRRNQHDSAALNGASCPAPHLAHLSSLSLSDSRRDFLIPHSRYVSSARRHSSSSPPPHRFVPPSAHPSRLLPSFPVASTPCNSAMSLFELPKLPYEYSALNPYMDTETMTVRCLPPPSTPRHHAPPLRFLLSPCLTTPCPSSLPITTAADFFRACRSTTLSTTRCTSTTSTACSAASMARRSRGCRSRRSSRACARCPKRSRRPSSTPAVCAARDLDRAFVAMW